MKNHVTFFIKNIYYFIYFFFFAIFTFLSHNNWRYDSLNYNGKYHFEINYSNVMYIIRMKFLKANNFERVISNQKILSFSMFIDGEVNRVK